MPFKVYRSSAGSGKTFTLVKEYLRIALSSGKTDSYRGILAVTFTNKAAEEMKSRVLEALRNLSEGSVESQTLQEILLQELTISEAELKTRAALVLKHMLHHYADVSISTIDRFSHRLIRTFAQDLGLSVNFEVELEQDVLQQAVLDELMNQVGTDPILTEALVDLVESTIEDEKGWNIDTRIKQFISVLFSEESRFHLEHLQKIDLREFSKLRKRIKAKINQSKKELKEIGSVSSTTIANNGLEASSFSYGANGIFGFYNKLKKGRLEMPGNRTTTNLENDKWYGSKATQNEKETIDGLKSDLSEAFYRAIELLKLHSYHQVVFNHVYGVALLDEMQRILQDIQEEEEVLHIGEFNHLISNVVMTETAPFIYERIGARYHHFLVDEFQDTSILQWFNLLPLIDESLAHDNLCLVVGDAKQSIYRWRGGDVQQFIELPKIHRPSHVDEKLTEQPHLDRLFKTRENTLAKASDIKTLESNYRSRSTVISFNNSLFDSLQNFMPEGFKEMYDGSHQESPKDEVGLVCVNMLRHDGDGQSWPEYDGLVQKQIKGWIDECLDDGYPAGDIAVIFRTNKDAVKTALFLIENGYDVVSNESLLINSSPSVRLLVNIAVFLQDPKNTTNVAELIQNLTESTAQSNNVSERLMSSKGGTGSKGVLELLEEAFPSIQWNNLLRETPYSLFAILIHGLFPHLNDPHLSFFQNEVLSFTQKKRAGLSEFLDYWFERRDKLSVALEENDNAISIITIHKSKGLEFPVVIHPYADYKDNSGKNSIWAYIDDKEMQPLDRLRISSSKTLLDTPFSDDHELENALESMDMFNQLYVALTRAKDRLYVSGKLKKKVAEDNNPSTAIQYVRKHLMADSENEVSELCYQMGSRLKHVGEKKKPVNLTLKDTGDPFWKDRVSIASPPPVSRQSLDGVDARLRGIAIHDALANVNTEKDVEKAVKGLVEEGRISDTEIADLNSHIHNLINRPDLKHLFSSDKTIRNEADIQLANGQWLRPDRVVTDGIKAWVIDYKTGEEREKYAKQIQEYKEAMTHLGFESVEGMLVYLDSENVVSI